MKINFSIHGKKVRYLMAGGLNTAVGLGMYPFLYIAIGKHFGYMGILVISQIICVTFSFFVNKFFVFRTKGNISAEYLKFFTFHLAYLILNILGLPIMVELLDMNPIIAQTIFAMCIAITSYFWHNIITFKIKEQKRV